VLVLSFQPPIGPYHGSSELESAPLDAGSGSPVVDWLGVGVPGAGFPGAAFPGATVLGIERVGGC
jgi:hypothetical protein